MKILKSIPPLMLVLFSIQTLYLPKQLFKYADKVIDGSSISTIQTFLAFVLTLLIVTILFLVATIGIWLLCDIWEIDEDVRDSI